MIPHLPCEEKRKKALRGFQGSPARRSTGFLLWEGEEKVRESSAELSPIDLLSCADGGQEASATGLLPITAAQGRSCLGNPPSSGTTSLLIVKLRPMRHNASSIPDYRGIHQFSQPKSFAIRYLSKMQLHVSALSASPRQGVQRESVRLGPNGLLCTHCHDGVVSPGTEHRTKWR